MKHIPSRLWAMMLLMVSVMLPSAVLADGSHRLTVVAKPTMAGSFNTNSADLVAGETIHLYAYSNGNFDFVHWTDNTGAVVSEQMDFTYIMPNRDVTLTAEYNYNPANPANPASNYWDREHGELIVDDFETGSLSNAVYNALGNSDDSKVNMLTVAGVINNNDFGIANYFSNCSVLDLSRVTGVTAVPSYAFDYANFESVKLPATIETIGYYAFGECSKLSSITLYAMTPPTLESEVFSGVPEGLVVYVPAGAIGQYQDSEAWNQFTLLPIQEDIRNITVSLSSGVKASDYARMWLEMTNTKSGQRIHYIMTDRSVYTFANIIKNTSWNVALRNERGDVFGKIDNVEVKDEDVSVSFASLSKPLNVSLKVQTPDGKNVTEQTQITWTDASGNYIAQGTSLSSLPVGCQLNYGVALSQDLAMLYGTPKAVAYTLKDGTNSLTCKLKAIKQVKVTGKVKDATSGLALSGAVISASQTFGGKYSKTINAKTDANGVYTLTVYDVPTTMAFAATDYISQSIVCDELIAGKATVDMNDVSLKPISGATINVGFTFTNVDGETQNWYSDYQNVSYTLYNKTRKKAINQFNVQYPQIVLLEEVSEGDVLELTAESKTQAFKRVKATATITANQTAEAQFSIVELGQLKAEYSQSGNVDVVASLYDVSGKLVKTYNYRDMSLTISNLADGKYTLVSMGSSQFFNSIYDLEQLPQSGLKAGTDYVQNAVSVKSGAVTTVNIDLVPKFDESKLYYTGDNTSFTVNKPSIVAGNYLTLTGHLSFKPAYESGVSNVQMIVDLPESSEFVENSVMVGNSTGSYTLNGHQLTIPMARYSDRVRFCIIPTAGGDYAPSAFAQFKLNGKTIKQPIGSANYTAKDLSISVPKTMAKTTIPVSGTAIGQSSVEIYDNGVLIGQTISLANGTWATTCELNEPYNLSTHNIYAKVTTKNGLELQSENEECKYDMNAIQVSKVTMYHWNPEWGKTYESVFDFQNPSAKPNQWTVYYPDKKFTYTVDFTNNSPEKVSNVVLYVHAADGQIVELYPKYDATKDIWTADLDMGGAPDAYYPVNVSVDFNATSIKLADRKAIDDGINELNSMIEEAKIERGTILSEANEDSVDDSNCKSLKTLLEQEDSSLEEIISLLDNITSDANGTDALSHDEIKKIYEECESEFEAWRSTAQELLKESVDDAYIDPSTNFNGDFSYYQNFDKDIKVYEKKKIASVNVKKMEEEGFEKVLLTDGSEIYYHYTNEGIEIVDVANLISYKIATNSEISNTRFQSKHVSGKLADYVDCGRKAVETMKTLYANRFQTSPNQLLANLTALGQVINFLCCFYEGFRADLQYNVTTKQAEMIKEFTSKIDRQTKYKEFIENSIGKYTDDIKVANKEWRELVESFNNTASNVNLSKEAKSIQLEKISAQIDAKVNQITKLKGLLKEETEYLNKILKNIEKLNKELEAVKKTGKIVTDALGKCPLRIVRGFKIPAFLRLSGKIAGEFGISLQAACLILDCYDTYDDLKAWIELQNGIETKIPCEANPYAALDLQERIIKSTQNHWSAHGATLFGEVMAIGFSAAGGIFLSPTWWAEMVISAICEWSKMINLDRSLDARVKYWMEIGQLKCKKDPDPDPDQDPNPNPGGNGGNGNGNGGNGNSGSANGNGTGGGHTSGSPDDDVSVDPSGFVYEGVFSNRLQGVIATVYYKETVENIYGDLHDNIVKWDAEEYAQQNPLFTDENGFYRWDVPQGLWQVKFEKEGYETTYSEWLPVPPPQLDINIAMTQNRQPEVIFARAFEDAVILEFDKYMQPELLITDNIGVMAGGKAVEGTIELLNEEVTREGETETFASKVRFNAVKPFEGKEVTLMVSNRVRSYAGIRMQDDFSQQFTIEEEVRQIDCKEMVKVAYGHNSTVSVAVLPASAAAAKTLRVKSSSAMILSTDAESLVLDKDGKAGVKVHGELPGTAALTFSVDGYDLTATTTVNVVTILLGDVNGDGEVNAADIVVLQNYLSDQQTAGIDESAADADGDGNITVADVPAIVAIILNKR